MGKLLVIILMNHLIWGLLACNSSSEPAPPPSRLNSPPQSEDGEGEKSSSASSSDDRKKKNLDSDAEPEETEDVKLLGAEVGTLKERRTLTQCNEKGYFYNREQKLCDKNWLVDETIICSKDGVLSGVKMNDAQKKTFENHLDNSLRGFLFDQCVFQKNSDKNITIYKIYLAKKDSSGSILIKSVSIEL